MLLVSAQNFLDSPCCIIASYIFWPSYHTSYIWGVKRPPICNPQESMTHIYENGPVTARRMYAERLWGSVPGKWMVPPCGRGPGMLKDTISLNSRIWQKIFFVFPFAYVLGMCWWQAGSPPWRGTSPGTEVVLREAEWRPCSLALPFLSDIPYSFQKYSESKWSFDSMLNTVLGKVGILSTYDLCAAFLAWSEKSTMLAAFCSHTCKNLRAGSTLKIHLLHPPTHIWCTSCFYN